MRSKANPSRLVIEPLEVRRLLAFALNVNFEPGGSAVPAGYMADTGAVYANRGNGFTYGWNASAATFARDRNASNSPDQRYDTLIHMQLYGTRTWEVAVPNGSYSVRIVAGDPSFTDSTMAIDAEGTLVVSGALSNANHFLDATKTVTVSDGRLTISNGAGAVNDKICFVQITSVSTSPSATPTVAISATDPTASEIGPDTGTFAVTRTGATTSALTVNYLIGGTATNGSDYDTLSGSVTIPAGASAANITVTPIADSLVEGNETVTLTLAAASGISLGTSSATVNIADGNSQPISGSNWPTSWTVGASLSKVRWESTSTQMNGKIYVFGGWMSAGTTGTQEYDMYDPATNTWTYLGYMPVSHTHSALAADPANQVIYFAGGLTGSYPGVPSAAVYKYDVVKNTWTALPSLPQVQAAGALSLINNKLYYFGGVSTNHDVNVGYNQVLDLGNLAAGWQSLAPMPIPRDHFSHVVLDGKIIAIGGEIGHDKLHEQQTLVDEYDPATNTWSSLAPIPVAKSHNESSTFVTPDGKIISAGGQIANFGITDDVIEYDPASNSWSTIGELPEGLQGPVVQEIGNQIIVATGNA